MFRVKYNYVQEHIRGVTQAKTGASDCALVKRDRDSLIT